MASDFPSIDTFGRRIMICGPSNAGKSTLALALSQKLGLPAIHLGGMGELNRLYRAWGLGRG